VYKCYFIYHNLVFNTGVIKMFQCLLYANYFIRSTLNILEGFIKLILVKGGVLDGLDVVI
jgi:hypothetical protein